MRDVREQLRGYGEQLETLMTPVESEEILTERVVEQEQPLRSHRPRRPIPGWVIAVAAGAAVLLSGLVFILARPLGDSQTPTLTVPDLTRVETPTTVSTIPDSDSTGAEPKDEYECPGQEFGRACPFTLPRHPEWEGGFIDPGTYVTRVFEPKFQFTIPGITYSAGESAAWVDIGVSTRSPSSGITVFSEALVQENDLHRAFEEGFAATGAAPDERCVPSGEAVKTAIGGFPTQLLEVSFVWVDGLNCGFTLTLNGQPEWDLTIIAGWPAMDMAFYLVNVNHQEIVAIAYAESFQDFDRYMKTEGQEILDSIEFLDDPKDEPGPAAS